VVRVPLAATADALAGLVTPAVAADAGSAADAASVDSGGTVPRPTPVRISRRDLERVARLATIGARRRTPTASPSAGPPPAAAGRQPATAAGADLAGARGIGVGPGP
jgi:hypothetical protein